MCSPPSLPPPPGEPLPPQALDSCAELGPAAAATSRPKITVAAATHRGSVRTANQDAGGAAGWLVADGGEVATLGPIGNPVTVVVADGAGGHPAGDVASRLAAAHLLAPSRWPETADELGALVGSAHVALHERMRTDPSTLGMTTTIAVLLVTERSVLVAHVGDTRVYELGPDGATLLTHDDRSASGGTALSQALGGPSPDRVPTPHLARLACEPGLRFLLCSDGVDACLDQPMLGQLVRAHADDAELVAAVVSAVLAAGAPDNVTVVVARVGEVGGGL